MINTKKPQSITVIILDRKTKKSKSFTVYGSFEEVYKKLRKAFKT